MKPAKRIIADLRPRRMADVLRGLLWISPWIAGFLFFTAAPVGLSCYYSFTDYSILEPPVFVGLANYRQMWHDDVFWIAVKNTLIYAAFSIMLGTVLAVGLAVLLNQNLRGTRLTRAAVFLPTLVPVVAGAINWLWLFNADFGLFNTVLAAFGVRGPNWLADPRWALPSLVFMGLWTVGGAVVIYLAALQEVPVSLYEAAELDGAGGWTRLRHVTLPLISPAILFNAVTAIIWSLQVFAVPRIMTEGGPNYATYFYTMHVYDHAFRFGQMGYASALAWVQFLGILILTAAVVRFSRRFVYYRAA